jgi:general secretion pathway protein K
MRRKLAAGVRRAQPGFALLLVLWGLLLLGLIAAAFLHETRLGTTFARTTVENAKAEQLSEAGVQRAFLGLLDDNPATAWRADGRVYRFALGEGAVAVRIEDEGGKIDLNHANAATLVRLFRAAGLDPDAARRLADAILDYVDRDAVRRAAGAEDPDYAAAGLQHAAKDALFERKEELLNVLGMTRAIYDAVAVGVTVHGGETEINRATAPELVLRAMPDITARELERIMAARNGPAPPGGAQIEVVTIRADASTKGGGHFLREVVARRGGSAGTPFQILDWRQKWQMPSS